MNSKADVVVVGAGVIGLSTAWQLRRRGVQKVVVLERSAGVGYGSTGASSAICRYRYSKTEMIALASSGIHEYQNWQDFTGLRTPRATFANDGVLWFTGDDNEWADREQKRLCDYGINTSVLDHHELRQRFPMINPCVAPIDLSDPESHQCVDGGRHLFEEDGGWIDPVDVAQDLLETCRNNNVDVRFSTEAKDFDIQGGKVRSVSTKQGERIDAPVIVNAAGPWCNSVYEALGLASPAPLTPVRIQVAYVSTPPQWERSAPVCCDMHSGIYFRSQNRGQQLLVSSVREEDERESIADPDDFLRVADSDFLAEKLYLLQHRLPELALTSAIKSYCGLYTLNENDVHPVIGPYDIEGLFVANGFSGHGFKIAPAVGAMLARQISGVRLENEDCSNDEWLHPHREAIHADSRSVLA